MNENDDLPDLCNADTLAAALKIQSAFKGYRVRQVHKVPMTPQSSIDFENLPPPSDNLFNQINTAKRVPPVPARFDSQKMQPDTKSTSKRVPKNIQAPETPKSPLIGRSNRLKEVSIPKVPQKNNESQSPSSSNKNCTPSESEQSLKDNETSTLIQQTLLRKESLTNFFKKQSETLSPTTPPENPRERERSFTKTLKDAGTNIRSRSKSKERVKAPLSLPVKGKDDQKSKIGGFFSSMFKKADKPKVTTPDTISPSNEALTNVKFKFNESVEKTELKKKPTRKVESSSDSESDRTPKNISREDVLVEQNVPQKSRPETKREVSKTKSANAKSVKSTKTVKSISTNESQDEDLKKDLIHVVLTAVEENWLNQAPKPHLDKVKALQAQDSDPELENSERSTSEADYVKKKMKAQKSEDLGSEDEGARLFKQESGDGEFPYVGITLPQEKSGTVSITPSNQRISECKLSSIDRPRSLSPRKAGKLEDYVQGQNQSLSPEEKIQVKLPRQESKGRLLKSKNDNESWDKFTAAGLQSPRQSRKVKTNTTNAARKPPTHLETKKAWVDCEKLPETKKTTKKYSADATKRRSGDSSDLSLQTLSGTQIVSPDECSCDCHHDTPPRILSPTSTHPPCRPHHHSGTKPKTNPRTTSVTARTKPIPSLKSKENGSSSSSSSSRPGPPPVPVRTTSVAKPNKSRSFRSTNTS